MKPNKISVILASSALSAVALGGFTMATATAAPVKAAHAAVMEKTAAKTTKKAKKKTTKSKTVAKPKTATKTTMAVPATPTTIKK
jgi:hypothetical protein